MRTERDRFIGLVQLTLALMAVAAIVAWLVNR
jgi:hypothetical protein